MLHRPPLFRPALLACVAGLVACGGDAPDDAAASGDAAMETASTAPSWSVPAPEPEVAPGSHVVDVVAEDYAFEAPDSIQSGWTTFRLHNEGEETHFVLVTRLPDGHTFDDYAGQVSAAVNEAWYQMRDEGLSKAAAFEMLGGAIPAWYWEGAETFGGPGMVIPGGVSQVTVDLAPGEYVLECFMKNADGEFHWSEGMLRPLTVTEERSPASAPEAQLRLTLTTEGIQMEGEPVAGTNTVEVDFADQPDVGFGNDIHVVHLEDGTTPESLIAWLDAFNVPGLQNPAPAPFVGGTEERPEGNSIFFSVDLVPGRYAFISESPEEVGGLFTEFTVN